MSTASIAARLRERRTDLDAAHLGLLIALLLFPLRFLASQIYIETIPIVLGVASGLYLLSVRGTRQRTATPSLPAVVAGGLPVLSFVGLSGMVLVARVSGGRTVPFYALAGVVGTLVLLQILFVGTGEFRPGRLIAQVLALALVLRLAALYTTPGYVGIDIWTHAELFRSIYDAGSLDAISSNKHFAAPFYHLLVVSTAHLLDVSLRNALVLSLGVAVPLSVLLVYAATKLLVPARWAIFAMALYAVADYFVEWGIHLIPTSHGLIFFLGICYALLRIMQTEYNVRDFVLLVLLTVAVILTHQVSSFIMLVVIGAGLFAQLVLRLDLFRSSPLDPDVFRTMSPVNLVGLLVFDVGFITFMWSLTPYNGDTFLETVMSYLARTLADSAGFLNLASGADSASAAAGATAQGPSTVEMVATYVDTLGFLLLLCLAIVGCFYVLRRRCASHSVFTLLFATTTMLVFVLGLPLFGIRNFIPQRWFAFLYVPMAVLAAIAVRYLSAHLNRRVFVACLALFALAYPGVMVMSSHGTVDSPVFPDHQERLSYTDAELHAVSTIGDITGSPDSANLRPDQVLRTDHPYQTVFRRTGAYPTDAAVIADGRPAQGDIKVYRTYQSDGASYFTDGNDGARIRDVPRDRVCRPADNTLYANGQVVMCTAP